MAINDKLLYTSTDFLTARANMIQIAQANFPQWNDFFESNNGVMLIELFAHVLDLLAFYQNRQANEAFIDRAQIRENIVSLAANIGYQLSTATAAIALVNFTLNTPSPNPIVIPGNNPLTRTRIQTANGLVFEVLADATIPVGSTSISNILVKQVETNDFATTSDGSPRQAFTLPISPFVNDGSVIVLVNNVPWSQVSNFLNSANTSTNFTVEIDSFNRGIIVFGDGVNGSIPPTGATIEVQYPVGGGSAGNVAPNTITQIQQTITDTLGNPVNILVTNPLPAVGGTDEEDINTARVNAPASIRALSRSVTKDDFKLNSLHVSDVARVNVLSLDDITVQYNIALGNGATVTFSGTLPNAPIRIGTLTIVAGTIFAVDANGDGIFDSTTGLIGGTINYSTGAFSITYLAPPVTGQPIIAEYVKLVTPFIPEDTVFLYVVPIGGGEAPQSLLNSVYNEVTNVFPNTITQRIIVATAIYKSIDLVGRIHIRSGFDLSTVRTNVVNALNTFFNPTTLDSSGNFVRNFGETLYPSELIATIQDAGGVLTVALTQIAGVSVSSLDTPIQLDIDQLPMLGNLNITFIDTAGNTLAVIEPAFNYEAGRGGSFV